MELTVIFLGTLAALAITWMAIGGRVNQSRRRLSNRIEKIRAHQAGEADETGRTQSVKKVGKSGVASLERVIKKLMPHQAALKDRLARTGRDIPISVYVLVNVGSVVCVAIAATIFGLPPALGLAIGVGAGVGLPHFIVGRMGAKRIAAFTALFPDAIDLIVRGLRSGLPITESIASVGREMADPVGKEFRHISDAVIFGQQLEEALWDTAKRLDTPEFKFFVISLTVQRETGGNLGETLANLSTILRSRKQMRLKIRAMSSEARASAMILGSLPFIMFGIIYFLNPGYETELFTDPRGRVMLGAALVTMATGIAVMAKMVRFEI